MVLSVWDRGEGQGREAGKDKKAGSASRQHCAQQGRDLQDLGFQQALQTFQSCSRAVFLLCLEEKNER